MKPRLMDRIARRFGYTKASQRTHGYIGAAHRGMLDWIRAPLSGNKELEGDLLTLRARSRDFARNAPYGRRFQRMVQNHIIGPRGIRLRPTNMIGARLHETLNDEIADAWRRWGKPRNASANGQHSWVGLQRLAAAELCQSGEAIFQIVYDAANPFGISLHPIDADRLDERHCVAAGPGQNEIRYGIEIDRIGRHIAYHILSQHPSELGRYATTSQYRERIPADQIIFLNGNDERVERFRGVPWYAAVLRDMRHLDGAQEASVVALRAAASQMIFIGTKDPNGDVETPDPDEVMELEPGIARYLGVNQEIQSWEPHAPSDRYVDFAKTVLRAGASGLGTSYAMLAGDWSDANMSSMRVGRSEEQEGWMAWQEYMIEHLCDRVFDAWLRSAILTGALRVPSFDVTRAESRMWHPRRWASPDPVKDASADEKRVALGTTSRTRIAAREGVDIWEVWEELEEEERYAKERGLIVAPPRTGATNDDDQNTAAGDDEDTAADGSASGDGDGTGADGGRGRRNNPHRHQLRIARSAI